MKSIRSGAFSAIVAVLLVTGADAQRASSSIPASPDDKTIVHVLNRLGFGPAPGDVDRVRTIGLVKYIDEQLHPATVADAAIASRLAGFETLTMSSRDLADKYFIPALMERRAAQRANAASAAGEEMRPDPAAGARREGPMDGERRVLVELTEQKILRAAYSARQLEEVMVDFWFNHFNVFAGKGQTRMFVTAYERDTIRPRVFGRFRDLLGAVAESPAMLFYLDNWQSGRRGVNENYARELMELHTLGVDGGYTQKDVQEIARAFTGWTIDAPRQGGGFRFAPRLHDDGEKVVLGTTLAPGGGKRDGERVLDILASHPSTARFLAAKLARRFVADDPPKALVDRAAARFRATDGDIREVVRTIVTSPEFFASAAHRAKVKTPLDFVASAVRASGVDVRNALPLVQALRQLGMPLYMCQPPTGYSDTADAWVNTGALLNRMNFAVTLAGNRPWTRGSEPVRADRIAATVLAGDVSVNTRTTVAKASNDRQAIALLLGSPDFQRK